MIAVVAGKFQLATRWIRHTFAVASANQTTGTFTLEDGRQLLVVIDRNQVLGCEFEDFILAPDAKDLDLIQTVMDRVMVSPPPPHQF